MTPGNRASYSLIQSKSAFTITAVTVVCWALALALAFFHITSGIRTDLGGVIAMTMTLRLLQSYFLLNLHQLQNTLHKIEYVNT